MQKKESPIRLDGTWHFAVDSTDRGVAEGWFRTDWDRRDWREITVPDYWDRYNLESYDGVGWYWRTVVVEDTSAPMTLYFAGVDDDADVWLNGERVGSHAGYSDAFWFDVTSHLRKGKNDLVVRVVDKGGPGGIYKPITLVRSDRIDDVLRTKYSRMKARPSAEWVKNAVIYEFYVRSFSPEGTFRGVEKRLPELKRLGVTVLWLMPIHPVGELNRKGSLGSPYSVRDYYAVNPEFGTLDDFRSLVRAVHAAGMHIITDLVANHTSWDSVLLMEHPEWFTHNAEGAIVAPNADWTDVADLNYDQHELRKYMIRMMKYWVADEHIDGYRCDDAELVPTDFWETARQELDAIKPVMMLSEGTLPEHHVEAFDLTYSWNVYDVLGKVINDTTSATIFNALLRTESYQFPRGSLRLRFNTNHDKNAFDAPAVEKFGPGGAMASAVLVFTMPGVPLIYNGEEVGNPKRLSLFERVPIDWSRGEAFRTLYEGLTALRAAHPALREGDDQPVETTDAPKIYAFVRSTGADRALVVISFARTQVTTLLKGKSVAGSVWTRVFGNGPESLPADSQRITLPAFGYAVYVSR